MTSHPQTKPVNIQLTSSEISGLWTTYFQESMSVCFLTYFLQHLRDEDILPLAEQSLEISRSRMNRIKEIFQEEQFPVPEAFSEKDVNLSAPQLFHDPFVLSFLYMTHRLSMITFGFSTANVARLDVLQFFTDCVNTSTEMFGKAVKMMLEKGLHDRPPKINYPDRIEYVEKESFLTGVIGDKRPLSVIELSEIYFNIERNYFSVIIMLAFAQVVKDKELKQFVLRGKQISEDQIKLFNKVLQDEDFLGIVSVDMEVTESTESPFSDKFIFCLINSLNAVDIVLISYALSMSMRADLVGHYTKLLGKIMLYAKDTFDIVAERKWLEQPPLATDRHKLIYS